MQVQGQGIDRPRLRRSSDAATPRIRKKRHTIPLLDSLHGSAPTDGERGPARRRFTNPFKRQNTILRNLISTLVMKGPTSLLSAYRYYFESSFVNPHHFTTYTRINGKLRGHIRIESRDGKSVMAPHQEDLTIARDLLVQRALESNSILLIDGNRTYSIDRTGIDRAIRKERTPVTSGLSRMVIPLDDMCGMIDITGEDLGFGLFRPVSTSLRIARDFSNLVAMKMAAEIDTLTGLLNRRAFENALEHCIRGYLEDGTNTSLLMIDIDHFKDVNDRHGHQNGDRVLASCALTAMSCFRESDMLGGRRKEMVARHGGEEFAVLLPGTSTEDAAKAGQRFKEMIESTVTTGIDGEEIRVTASVGVADLKDTRPHMPAVVVFPVDGGGVRISRVEERIKNTIVKLADRALYSAKRLGRNQVVPTPNGRRMAGLSVI